MHEEERAVVERYLLLRDGSILRLPVVDEAWKVPVVRQDGQIDQMTIRLSELQRITFTREPLFEKKPTTVEIL